MPTFDSGAYFLTTLIPVRTDAVFDDGAATSPVHALRKELAKLPTGEKSPFARNVRNHFSRLVVIDDVAYNGREQPNTLLVAVGDLFPIKALDKFKKRLDPVIAQPQDHLSCPFLFFSADFDAASGADSERDSYLRELWSSASNELKNIFRYCRDFEQRVRDADSFIAYIAACQIETTMPFHDYWPDVVPLAQLPTLSLQKMLVVLGVPAAITFALSYWLLLPEWPRGLWFLAAAAIGLAAGVGALYAYVAREGSKPYPPAPGATLPDVLKALHLRREFTRFAIDNQFDAAGDDEASATRLYAAFQAFAAANRPNDAGAPTQRPGVVGI